MDTRHVPIHLAPSHICRPRPLPEFGKLPSLDSLDMQTHLRIAFLGIRLHRSEALVDLLEAFFEIVF